MNKQDYGNLKNYAENNIGEMPSNLFSISYMFLEFIKNKIYSQYNDKICLFPYTEINTVEERVSFGWKFGDKNMCFTVITEDVLQGDFTIGESYKNDKLPEDIPHEGESLANIFKWLFGN